MTDVQREHGNALTVGEALRCELQQRAIDRWGDKATIRQLIRDEKLSRSLMRKDMRRWAADAPEQGIVQERIIDLALDSLDSEALYPAYRLLTTAHRLPDIPVHALVFSAFPHIGNELYPLLVDAFVDSMEQYSAPMAVIAVHEDWLFDGSCRRAIIFDPETQGLFEADLLERPHIASAQVLALNLCEEHQSHQRIERALPNIPFANPYAGTAKLDDKYWTGQCWRKAGVVTPACIALSMASSDAEITDAIEKFAAQYGEQLVMKPADGTEGRGVEFFTATIDPSEWLPRVRSALQRGTVLISPQHGMLRFADDCGPVRCAVRVNCCWDGSRVHVESGYAQVAGGIDGIASAGRGGRVISLPTLWSRLCFSDGKAYTPTSADWHNLLSTAIQAVRELAVQLDTAMPALNGVDILLDVDAAHLLQPVLLEANGRPSGMGHSRFVSESGPTDEPGVSMHLWSRVRTLQKHGVHELGGES